MNAILRWGGIAGIVYLTTLLPTIILSALYLIGSLDTTGIAIYLVLNVFITIVACFYAYTVFVLGKKTKVKILKIGAILSIFWFITSLGILLVDLLLYPRIILKGNIVFNIFSGMVILPWAIGFLKLKPMFGGLAKAVGVLGIIGTIVNLSVIFSSLSILLSIASTIVEVLILFRASKMYQ